MRSYTQLDLDVAGQHGLPLVGVDEVGIGPLAGPVCACALMVGEADALLVSDDEAEVDDSKKLTREEREHLFPRIVSVSIHALGWVQVEEINRIRNVTQCGHLARRRAVAHLVRKCRAARRPVPAAIISDWFDMPGSIPCVHPSKADSLSFLVACASVVAKVHRDRLMMKLHEQFPHYDWYRNVGYPTPFHVEAIRRFGTTPLHREHLTQNIGKTGQGKGWASMTRRMVR